MTPETTRTSLTPRYDHRQVEERWYRMWENKGFFKPDLKSDLPPFVITIPPPNVTGDLHIGHVLTYGIEDVVGRFKRMQGFNTFIVPGSDHAGIATQNVVEKQLASEGLTRHDLGREKFVERVWEWKEKYAANIRNQFRAMGCGYDWSAERFTMDPGYVDAVLEFFIRLYDEKQIYRGWRVINWCPRCHSAISDIEVEDEQRDDKLYYLRYPLADGADEIVVATVRPETILGDVAIAVNPADSRYTSYVGKTARLPLLDRSLNILADPMVDMSFGTGAVKITPAHDFADFEVAERHALDRPIAIDADSKITDVGGPYKGLTVSQAREHVLRDLESGGFLLKEETYSHNVPTCERCGTLVEPLLSEQWFMRMEDLARPAIDAARQGDVTFVPERWTRIYVQWLENIRPWTLSRQLWWGHRIPVYYCGKGHATAAKAWPKACATCGEAVERQDPDVLDTWFSSALWPFAALGWPEETENLKRFYPTSFMNTSSQILYLWIARMVMTGLKFMGRAPFPDVLINPTILTKTGQRMSKSLGTGTDPSILIRDHGADALRFGLLTSGSTHQQDIRFSTERVELARNFANKLWNVARAILDQQQDSPGEQIALTLPDRWILSRLHAVIASVTADLERYEFSGAGHTLQDFIWNEVADWYLEIAKLRLYAEDNPVGRDTAAAVLWSVMDRVVRLVHPFMPFISEEIWQHIRLCGSASARRLSGWAEPLGDSVMAAPWPAPGTLHPESETEMQLVMDIIRTVRAVRSEYCAPPGEFLPATIVAGRSFHNLQGEFDIIARLARLGPLVVHETLPEKPSDAVAVLAGPVTVYIPLAHLTDIAAERTRLIREREKVEGALETLSVKLGNEAFASRAPQDVVARERGRASELKETLRRLQDRLDTLPT